MKSYIVEEMQNKEIYCRFIKIMLKHSDAFSLVYFKYRSSELSRFSAWRVRKQLKPYLIYSHYGDEWPAMKTYNQFGHIYDIALYRADPLTEKALCKVNNLFDWDYPKFPMDLCFYNNGYGWFACCSHEEYAILYTDDEKIIAELENAGVELSYDGDVSTSQLFYDEKAKLN